ncbi:MAG: BatA and WFA domain-containing protein [Deinococcales bacterium]
MAALSFAAPQFLWALTALPVVVLLHFVRARRRRHQVSALFLWERARMVAERRRRISPTWLLLAQLLFVALAAFALARPQIGGGVAPDRILVIDASASMAARDSDGLRIDKARAEAERLLSGAGRIAVVRAGLDARVVLPLTGDRAEVRRALQGLRVGDRSADLERAVGVAEAIERGAQVELITDQPPVGGATVAYHNVAGDGINVGISAFDLGIQQAYVGVVSNSRRPVQVQVALSRDGQSVASGSVLVPADGTGSITFPLAEVRGVYRAAITPPAGISAGDPAGDALTLDDVAYAGARQVSAVVEQSNEAVVKALAAVPGVTVRVNAAAAQVGADLRVLTRSSAEGLAPGSYLLFAPASSQPEYRVIRAFDRGSTLMRFVDLQDVVVGLDPQRTRWQPGSGWQVLASTGELEPVLRYRDSGGVRVLQAAFNPAQTDLVLRAAFPALIANYIRQVRGDATLELGASLPPGTTLDGAAAAYALRPGVYQEPGGLPGPGAAKQADRAAGGRSGAPGVLGEAPVSSLALVLLLLALLALVAEWLLWSGLPVLRWPRPPSWLRRRPGRGP